MESSDLRKAGLKVTLPRMKILEILETNETRHMSAEVIDGGRTLRTESRFTVETQQAKAPMRITTEYRLHSGGDRLTLIELRSSRTKPIVHHFTRKS